MPIFHILNNLFSVFYVSHWVTTDFNQKFAKKCRVSILWRVFGRKLAKIYREIPLFSQIWRYLKTTGNLLSGVRNTLETPNLDQGYLLELSWRLERDFSKFWFFAPFWVILDPKIAILTPRGWKMTKKWVKNQNVEKPLWSLQDTSKEYLWSTFGVSRVFLAQESAFPWFWDILDFVKIREFPYIFWPTFGLKMAEKCWLWTFWQIFYLNLF